MQLWRTRAQLFWIFHFHNKLNSPFHFYQLVQRSTPHPFCDSLIQIQSPPSFSSKLPRSGPLSLIHHRWSHWIGDAGGCFGYLLLKSSRRCPHQSPLSRRCRVILYLCCTHLLIMFRNCQINFSFFNSYKLMLIRNCLRDEWN